MVARAVVTLAIAALVAGCGDDAKQTSGTAKSVAGRVSAWSDSAIAYSQIVGQCMRQPNPGRGYWDDCTGEYRAQYTRATRAVVKAVRECAAAAGLPKLVSADSAALSFESKWNRAFLDNFPNDYTGPSLLALRDRSAEATKRASHAADSLAARLKAHGC
jgi:hypothetical protein